MKLTTTSIYPAFMAIMLLAAGLVLSDVASPLRAALGLAAVLLIPGYMLMGALIPSSETLGWKTRLGVSLAISVALQPLLAVLLNVTVGNIARNPMVYGLTAFSLVAGGIAWVRSWGKGVSFGALVRPQSSGALVATLGIIAAVSLFGAIRFTGGNLLLDVSTTEFYLIGPQSGTGLYPTAAEAGKPVTILVGITNREGREIHYLLNARTSGQELGVQQQVTVADGSRWQGPITFTLPPAAGPDEVSVELVLRRENAPADYRVLRLWLGPA